MLAFLAGVIALAQNLPGTAAIDNKLDTPQARVYVATLPPNTPIPLRTGHATNRVLIYLDSGLMTRKDGSDKIQKIEFHRGDVRWRPASGAYVAENISDHPIRILEIDLKDKPQGPAPVSKLDPTVVDAKHYKVELENADESEYWRSRIAELSTVDCKRPVYKKAVNDDPLSFTATLVRCSRERGCSRVGTATGFLRDADCSAN